MDMPDAERGPTDFASTAEFVHVYEAFHDDRLTTDAETLERASGWQARPSVVPTFRSGQCGEAGEGVDHIHVTDLALAQIPDAPWWSW